MTYRHTNRPRIGESRPRHSVQSIHFGIVIFHNSPEIIEKSVRSIESSCHVADVEFSITLLRNSNEHLPLSEYVHNNVRLIDFTHNLGFGAGHNAIVRRISDPVEWYVGLNPDGFLSPWAIEAACLFVERTTDLYEFQQHPQEHAKVFDKESGKTPWCSGAAFMISIEYFRSLGGFDDRFFLYCEDVDLSWRVQETSGRCLLIPGALFFHDMIDERSAPVQIRQMLLSQALLARKWGAGMSERKAIARLRKFESRNRLPPATIPDVPKQEFRANPPRFCELRHPGSYSKTRW